MIAPVDGVAQRLLARWCVAYTARQHRQALAQPSEQRWWRQQFDAGRGQFNRQRQAIQAGTDLGDCRGAGIAHLEIGLERLGACNEECHRLILRQRHEVGQVVEIGQRERRDGKLVLSREVEHRAAGDQQLEV